MGKLTLLRLDSPSDVEQDDQNKKFVFSGPVVSIGRGSSLGCTDKRVSRNHGALRLSHDGSIVLEAYNINPCFYKTHEQDSYAVLMKGQKRILAVGDEFSLLPHNFQYRICAVDEQEDTCVAAAGDDIQFNEDKLELPRVFQNKENEKDMPTTSKLKRKIPQWLSDLPIDDAPLTVKCKKRKQQRQDLGTSSANIPKLIDENTLLSQTQLLTRPVAMPNDNPPTIKEEVNTASEEHTLTDEMARVATELKCEDDETHDEPRGENLHDMKCQSEKNDSNSCNEDSNPSSTPVINSIDPGSSSNAGGTLPSRDVCIYGKNCFRKNAQHRQDFSHPGDADYDVSTDNLPECPYGTSCYRKNVQHRKDFKHTQRMQRTQPVNIPPSSNVYCTNCTITYNICSRCQRVDTDVIDLTVNDDDNSKEKN